MEIILDELSATRFNKIEHVSETGSTNLDLISSASNTLDGSVLVADYQSDGRGRLGRNWEAPKAQNLLFSVLLHQKWDPSRNQLITTALALSTIKVLEKLGLQAKIKWPNDVMVERQKLCKIGGILAEYVHQKDPILVVGMGLNVGWPNKEGSGPPEATSLKACGIEKNRWELLVEVLKNFESYLIELDKKEGDSYLRDEHLSRSATIGQRVRAEKKDEMIIGKAVDIEEDGSLVIENQDGLISVKTGEVNLLRSI